LLESAEPSGALALDYFVYLVGLLAGMFAAALGGLDAFVFTAGIGEKSAQLRARIAAALAWLGVSIDSVANESGKPKISKSTSKVALYVVPTNEESMIAHHTLGVLSSNRKHGIEYKRSA